jgi:hypothetical protein
LIFAHGPLAERYLNGPRELFPVERGAASASLYNRQFAKLNPLERCEPGAAL